MPIKPVRSSVHLLLAVVVTIALFASAHAQIIPGISIRESGCTERRDNNSHRGHRAHGAKAIPSASSVCSVNSVATYSA